MAAHKPEIPPPKRGRGRPPVFVAGRDGKEISGLSRKSDRRYYATYSKPREYFGTDFDSALVRFREWQAKQHKDFVSLGAERPAGWFKGKEFRTGKPHLYLDVPFEAYDAMVLSADFSGRL